MPIVINKRKMRFLFAPALPGIIALIAVSIFYFTARHKNAQIAVPQETGEIRYDLTHKEFAEKEHIPVEYYGRCMCGPEQCLQAVRVVQPITRFYPNGDKEQYEKDLRVEWRKCEVSG